jgi:hypothetical protein
MTVGELCEKLQKCGDDIEVFLYNPEYDEGFELDRVEVNLGFTRKSAWSGLSISFETSTKGDSVAVVLR